MRTGSEAIAPSSAARWEIDLSAGARSSPDSARAGSKRMFIGRPSCLHDGEAEVGDQLPSARGWALAADPQRDDPLAVVLGGREHHVEDVHAGAAERERDLGDHAGAVGHRDAQLEHGNAVDAADEPGAEQLVTIAARAL